MTVYIDDARHKLGRMFLSHMLADTIEELHAMADRVGLSRRHYQGPPKSKRPHYDICQKKRALAIRNGAIPVTRREMAKHARAARLQGHANEK